jgi:Co/Zn/Cd efflux system component
MTTINPMMKNHGCLWPSATAYGKNHNFLHEDHATNEIRTWLVIFLCAASMVIEVTCGILFGSLALVADGLHMSTHVIAFA